MAENFLSPQIAESRTLRGLHGSRGISLRKYGLRQDRVARFFHRCIGNGVYTVFVFTVRTQRADRTARGRGEGGGERRTTSTMRQVRAGL